MSQQKKKWWEFHFLVWKRWNCRVWRVIVHHSFLPSLWTACLHRCCCQILHPQWMPLQQEGPSLPPQMLQQGFLVHWWSGNGCWMTQQGRILIKRTKLQIIIIFSITITPFHYRCVENDATSKLKCLCPSWQQGNKK